MEDSEKRTLKAAVTQLKFVDEQNAVWTGDAGMQDSRDELSDEIDYVNAEEAIQEKDNKGMVVFKDKLKLDAAKKGLMVAKVMKVFAKKSGNETLKGEIGFTFSELYYGEEAVLVQRWKLIFERGTTNLSAMAAAGFKITGTMVTDVDSARGAFVKFQTQPSVAKVGVKTATYNIKEAMKDLDNYAEDLIDLSVTYSVTNPDFVKGVEDAYRKGQLGVKHIYLILNFVDDVTGVTLKNVKTTTTDGTNIYPGKSTRLGNVREKSMVNGNYVITSTLATYVTDVRKGVAIAEGKINKIMIRLKKS